MCVWWEGQHAHDLADLIQLAPFSLTEVLSCMSHSIQALVLPDKFDELLNPEAEL